jgi:DNA repair protein RecO (recombination protein O)
LALYRTDGIVLRTWDLGEADRVAVILTEEEGKIPAVAKGARRPRCRLRSVSQNFVLAHYLMYSGRSLDTISQGELKSSFAPLRDELVKMAYASYMAELVDKFTVERAKAPEIFYLLLQVFDVASKHDYLEVIARWFEIRLMTLLGYSPHLDTCVRCGHTVNEGVFLPEDGGIAHSSCAPRAEYPLSQAALACMRSLASMSVLGVMNLRISKQVELQMRLALRAHIAQNLTSELKSLDFLLSVIG